MKNIPFHDLSGQWQLLRSEIMTATEKVFSTQAFAGGPFVEEFEARFAEYCNTRFAVGVSNGTDALHLMLRALDVGPGDEIILPANTFIATAWAVSYCGATPVFVDCYPDTWNMDVGAVEKSITNKTRGIIGVHLYGQPCDIDQLRFLADKRDLFFVEDCAQAHGAIYKGKRVGSFGVLAGFSFYPGKNLGAYGEAGAVTTDDEALASRIKSLRNHGSVQRYHHDELGYNHRMDGLQGAILTVKLAYLDRWNARRRQIASLYQSHIRNPHIKMQVEQRDTQSVYHLFVIMINHERGRGAFQDHMKNCGINLGIHYPIPCHLQNAFRHLSYSPGSLINAESLASCCVSLPMFPELSDADVECIIESVNTFE